MCGPHRPHACNGSVANQHAGALDHRVPEWRSHHFAIASASHLSCVQRVCCRCHVLGGSKSRRREDRTLAFLSIGYCGVLLLTQVVLVIRSLKPDLPLNPSAIGRTLGVTIAIMLRSTKYRSSHTSNADSRPAGTWGRSMGQGTCEPKPELGSYLRSR